MAHVLVAPRAVAARSQSALVLCAHPLNAALASTLSAAYTGATSDRNAAANAAEDGDCTVKVVIGGQQWSRAALEAHVRRGDFIAVRRGDFDASVLVQRSITVRFFFAISILIINCVLIEFWCHDKCTTTPHSAHWRGCELSARFVTTAECGVRLPRRRWWWRRPLVPAEAAWRTRLLRVPSG